MTSVMPEASVSAQLDALRAELADLAYELECQGRREAADVAMMLRARLGEIVGEGSGGGSSGCMPGEGTRPTSPGRPRPGGLTAPRG